MFNMNLEDLKGVGLVPQNSIINADCLEAMKYIADKSVDMILCDLPYGTTACKWDVVIPFEPLWEQYKRIIKDNGAIVLTASQPFTSALVMSNIKMFKYEWIWEKTTSGNFLQSNFQPRKIHEDICIFSKYSASYTKNGKKMNYFPQMWGETDYQINENKNIPKFWERRKSEGYNVKVTNISGKKFPQSIIKFKTDKEKLHPTQKPVALFEYLIQTYTNENDVVLDNCAGSGTTGVACINTGRNYILIEKDEKYYEIARQRIEEALCKTK